MAAKHLNRSSKSLQHEQSAMIKKRKSDIPAKQINSRSSKVIIEQKSTQNCFCMFVLLYYLQSTNLHINCLNCNIDIKQMCSLASYKKSNWCHKSIKLVMGLSLCWSKRQHCIEIDHLGSNSLFFFLDLIMHQKFRFPKFVQLKEHQSYFQNDRIEENKLDPTDSIVLSNRTEF